MGGASGLIPGHGVLPTSLSDRLPLIFQFAHHHFQEAFPDLPTPCSWSALPFMCFHWILALPKTQAQACPSLLTGATMRERRPPWLQASS